jgi:hypothetical protein
MGAFITSDKNIKSEIFFDYVINKPGQKNVNHEFPVAVCFHIKNNKSLYTFKRDLTLL